MASRNVDISNGEDTVEDPAKEIFEIARSALTHSTSRLLWKLGFNAKTNLVILNAIFAEGSLVGHFIRPISA